MTRGRSGCSVEELESSAKRLRAHVVRMVAKAGIGYLQQGLGAADLLTALYQDELKLRESEPGWVDRDRMILSTAHNTAVLYAAMAERGLIAPAALDTYTEDGSPFEVNASERVGALIEATCGSLGQGLSVGVGMALSLRRQLRSSRVYVVLGDGELQEGQVWEAALSAGAYELDNLCLIIDRNFMQVDGHTDKVMKLEPLAEKWTAFGWAVDTIDGNAMGCIIESFAAARAACGRPTCIIAETVPGKGVHFLEGQLKHIAALGREDADRALKVLRS